MYLDVSLHIIYINSKADRPFFRKLFQMTKTKRAKAIPHYVVLKWNKKHPMIDPMYPIKKEWEIIKEYDDTFL